MKRNLLVTAVLFAIGTLFNVNANAQVSAVSLPVAVSISLTDAISITLGSTPDVLFTYATAADYGVADKLVAKANHFYVTSTKPYNVAVKANSVFNTINTTTPPLSVVHIAVDPATASGGTLTTATLSTTNATLVTAATAAIAKAYTINYTIPTAAPLLGMSAGTYTTNIVYTVTQN